MQNNVNDSDETLVINLQAGDKMALTILVKRWHKLFCSKAYWLIKDKEVAKDIAQDSWTIIINKIDTLKDPKQFKYWAYRIVCNKATDWLREQALERHNTYRSEIEVEYKDIPYSENEVLRQILSKAIHNLPSNQKIVIKLFYLETYSLKQISNLLGISTGTAKSRLFHAREKLKITLKYRNYEN